MSLESLYSGKHKMNQKTARDLIERSYLSTSQAWFSGLYEGLLVVHVWHCIATNDSLSRVVSP